MAHLERYGRAAGRLVAEPEFRAKVGRRVQREAARAGRRITRRGALRSGLDLPPVNVPDGPVARPDLTVATILDPFSELALRYEWDQVAVTPAGWRVELTTRRPQLLFAESAWRGNQEAWRLAMTGEGAPSAELRELVAWCRAEGIPTVFWNKEDPPNYDRFIETARLFDHVFTVDADKIPDYRRDLGHDRVGLLPFGAQPRIHNPVRTGRARHHDVAFAGTYFTDKHPERRAQMDALLPAAQQHGLHIYSRMTSEDRRYQFPAQLRGDVVGTLPYERMLAAASAYKLFLNVNSVTGSPTMCARRLFELSAAQVPVVSGPAASINPFFGDTITVAHDAEEAEDAIGALMAQPEIRDRIALRAHRRVFDQHLYADRVDTVLEAVGLPTQPRTRRISAVVPTMRPGQVEHVLGTIASQVHPDVELVLVTHGFTVGDDVTARARELGIELTLVPADAELTLGACMNLGVGAASGDHVAKIDDDNYYAPHYLSDLARAFDYSSAQVVGKWAHLVHLRGSGATMLRFERSEHRYTDLVQGGTLLVPTDVAREVRFENLPRRVDTTFLEKVRQQGGLVYSADRFNFVSMRAATTEGHTWGITDAQLLRRSSRVLFFGDPVAHATV